MLVGPVFLAFFASLQAAGVSAAPGCFADTGISVELSGPSTVAAVKDLRVLTTVTNTASQGIKLLAHPNSPFGQATNIFDVTRSCGAKAEFVGREVGPPFIFQAEEYVAEARCIVRCRCLQCKRSYFLKSRSIDPNIPR